MRKWIITFFGSGLAPVAPGTMGSILASVLLLGAYPLLAASWQFVLLGGLVVASVLMVQLGPWAVAYFGREDPQACVLDEAAGICLTNLLLPVLAGWREAVVIGLALLAFRLFDITKPPPAKQLEHLPMGWGILLDDLAAAVYANLLCQVVLRVAISRGIL